MRVTVPISPRELTLPVASDLVALVLKESGAHMNNTVRRDIRAVLTNQLESFVQFQWPVTYRASARSAVILDPSSEQEFCVVAYHEGTQRYVPEHERTLQETIQQAVLHYTTGLTSDGKRRE